MKTKTAEEAILNVAKDVLDKYSLDIPDRLQKINPDLGDYKVASEKEIKKWKKAFRKHLNVQARKHRCKRLMRKIFMSRKKRREIEFAEFVKFGCTAMSATFIYQREMNKKLIINAINAYNPDYLKANKKV